MKIAHLAVYKDKNVSVYFLQQTYKGETKNVENDDKQKEMKENKALYVTNHRRRYEQSPIGQLYRNERDPWQRWETKSNFSSQFDSKRDNNICTCKNLSNKKQNEFKYFGGLPKQIYSYRTSRSYIDIGVGSVKALHRRKIRRVYLREYDDTGVGSSDLSSYIAPKRRLKVARHRDSYDSKRMSSKCVGGILEYNTGCAINEKLSPIINTKSFATSPETFTVLNNIEIGSNTVQKKTETIGVQFDTENEINKQEFTKAADQKPSKLKLIRKISEHPAKSRDTDKINEDKKKPEDGKEKKGEKTYSSDSLLQHIHNLEYPSKEQHSETSFRDPAENILEKEYRKMFATAKSKHSKSSNETPVSLFKSASILRRRFEALKRGIVKKDDSGSKKHESVVMQMFKQESILTHKDASVASDPPSLVSRSYSNMKKYSPIVGPNKKQMNYKKKKDSAQWQQNSSHCESQGVKGMFKLWGKKFNFEEDAESKKFPTPMYSYVKPKKSVKEVKQIPAEVKKENKKFFFFKKKAKDKNKVAYKPKKNVTAGRCELREGLVLNIGGAATTTPKVIAKISEETNEITHRTWLRRFLSNTIESARSVNVRWNNNTFGTSSSTVFELLDSVYKNTGVVIRSRSEITTEESSFYRSFTKNKVNFVRDIDAWMIPKTILDKPIKIISSRTKAKESKEKNMKIMMLNHKLFLKKSDAFSHTVEVVLNSNELVNLGDNSVSSECLKIDIPKDFFNVSSSNESKRNHSSDEKVFQIVEYETNSEIRSRKAINDFEKGSHASNDVQVIVNVKDSKKLESKILEAVIKRLPTDGEGLVKGGSVSSKRFDVIKVGIITQRDIREIRKPILKIQDDFTDYDDSDPIPKMNRKKCEFAESYLQEYYRHWTPLGIDLYSWCFSDSQVRSCSEKSFTSFQDQGDGSKSCPNIYKDFHTATIVASGETSRSPCAYEDQCCNNDKLSYKFKKFMKLSKSKTESELTEKRILPKDSLEVFKRRKIYAASGKSQWVGCSGEDKPVSVPSVDSKLSIHSTLMGCPKLEKPLNCPPRPKSCKKHVSMPDCETMNTTTCRQLTDKVEGILQFKGAVCDFCKIKDGKCSKHIIVNPKPTCEIPEPPCKPSCEKMKRPSCNKPHSPSCNEFPKRPSDTNICPKPPLPPSCGPRQLPRCFPPESPCKTPPCPAALPPCIMIPSSCQISSQLSCSPCVKSCSNKSKSKSACSSPLLPCKKSCSSHSPCEKSSPITSILSWIKSNTSCSKPKSCSNSEKCCSLPCAKNCFPEQSPCKSSKQVLSPCSSNERVHPLKRVKTPCGSIQSAQKNNKCSLPKICISKQSCPQKPCSSKSSLRPKSCSRKPSCLSKPCSAKPSCPPRPCSPKPSCPPEPISQKPSCPPKPCSPKPFCPPKPSCVSKSCSPNPSCLSITCSPKPYSPKPSCPPKPCSPKPSCPPTPCSPIPSCPSKPCSPKPSCPPKPCSPKPSCPPTPCSPKPSCPPKPCSPKASCPPKPCSPKPSYPPKPSCPPKPSSSKQSCPPKPCSPNPAYLPKINFRSVSPCTPKCTKSKISGLFLKLLPSGIKKCSLDCTSWDQSNKLQGVKLSSDENITIKIKKESPSTEEIRPQCRESRNYKVQDEDGRTLFERKDYICEAQRHSVLGDLYKESKINRVATPITVTNMATDENQKDLSVIKSDQILPNSIEIHFKLRITQGDKIAEVNVGNEDDDVEQNAGTEIKKANPEIYIVKNGVENIVEDYPKNDINIKITVRNFMPTHRKFAQKRCSDEFSKKISEKFHTVSTGYSDFGVDDNEDHVFSVHRATVNLSSSGGISNAPSRITNEQNSKVLSTGFQQNLTISSHTPIDMAENIEKISVSSKQDSQTEKIQETNTNESVLPDFNDTDEHDEHLLAFSSNECNVQSVISKHASKEKKKGLLKKVFQKAGTQGKSKKSVRELRDMLKIILTDSSDNENTKSSNELLKDVTYASLKPNYFRDTDSMNNYYRLDSNLSLIKDSKTEAIYPTEDEISQTSETSDSYANDITFEGCMCSRVAKKLNEANMKLSCCCRQKQIKDEETNCDLRNDLDLFLLNYKTTEFVDVETQNSKHFSRDNSLRFSVQSKQEDITVADKIDILKSSQSSKGLLKNMSQHKSVVKEREINETRSTVFASESENDHAKVLSVKPTKVLSESSSKKILRNSTNSTNCMEYLESDVLQSCAVKKAVLEIYAEKTDDDRFVAKLPKFVVERENEIVNNYKQIASNSYKSVCSKNIVMMSIRH